MMWSNILFFAILVYSPIAGDILSKFHQNDYKIRDMRVELDSYDKNYMNYVRIVTYKFNRTTPAVNVTFNFKIDIDDRLEIVVQLYKFASNEYREFPTRFELNAKKAMKANAGGSSVFLKCGNIRDIYFKKNTDYIVCNTILDETQLPPLVPAGRYRAAVGFLFLDHLLMQASSYMEFYYPIKIPTHK